MKHDVQKAVEIVRASVEYGQREATMVFVSFLTYFEAVDPNFDGEAFALACTEPDEESRLALS